MGKRENDVEPAAVSAADDAGLTEPADQDGQLTRRRLVGGLGGSALAGAAFSAVPFAAVAAETEAEAAGKASTLGTGGSGRAVASFIGIIKQIGTSMKATGYLTALKGLKPNSLFTTPRGVNFTDPNSLDEGKARFTIYSDATIQRLSSVDAEKGDPGNKFANILAEAKGDLKIYYRKNGGADFSNPSSFKNGNPIARYTGTFQDQLTLQPPNWQDEASVALGGFLKQRVRRNFHLGKTRRIGHRGDQRMISATGWGTLTNPTGPESTIWIAGSLIVVGKDG